MTSLTFYGGVGEIGGNKILLRDGDTSIFLDFGKNFERERRFYDEPYLSPREEKHLIYLGILPKISGLYKKDEAEPKENKDYDCKHYESCSISRYEQNVHASESKNNKE